MSLPTTNVGIWYQVETLVFLQCRITGHFRREKFTTMNKLCTFYRTRLIHLMISCGDETTYRCTEKKPILSSSVKVNNLHNCSCEKLFSAPQSIMVWILNPKSPQALPRRREVWKNWFNASQQTHTKMKIEFLVGTVLDDLWRMWVHVRKDQSTSLFVPAKLTTSVKRSHKRLNSLMTFLCCNFLPSTPTEPTHFKV